MISDCKMNRKIIKARNILQCAFIVEDFFIKFVSDVLQMLQNCGALAELVYALVLGTSVFGHESSSLLRPTNYSIYAIKNLLHFSFFWVTAQLSLVVMDSITFRMYPKCMPNRLRI